MLLAASLAVPALALFYLLRLRRAPMRVTSTMFWDQAARDLEVNVPFRWIRPSWLLLLHALILGCLLVAIGRPAITDAGGVAGRVYLLIDRSASMNAPGDDTDTTRLDAAKRRARTLVARYLEGADPPEVTVIAFASDSVVMGPPARDAGSIGAMIDAVTPTDEPGDPRSAAELVRALTAPGDRATESDEDAEAPPLAVMITDGGDLAPSGSSGSGSLSAGAVTIRVDVVGGAGSSASPVPTDPPPTNPIPTNLGIIAFAADREFESPETVRVFLRLMNTGASEASVPITLLLDGEPLASRAVTIPGRSGSGVSSTPGEQADAFRVTSPAGGVLTVSLGRTDALPADNVVHATLPPVRRPAVLVVVPDAPASAQTPPPARDRVDPILLDILDAIGTAGVRVIERGRYAQNLEGLGDRFGLVVFDRVRPASMPPVPTLSFGAPLPLELGIAPSIVRTNEVGRTPVLSWDRDHPAMRDAVLDSIVVGDRFAFPEADDARLADSEMSIDTLARGRDGPLIVALDDRGTRRIATAFALEQSNWPVHFSFPIFVLGAFDFLVPGSESASWHATGEPITLTAPLGARTIEIEGPAPRTVRLEGDAGGTDNGIDSGTRAVAIAGLPRVGLYSARTATTRQPIPVNLLSPGESALRVGSRIGAGAGDAEGSEAAAAGAQRGEGTREIWRWFVLAAGVGLLLEWVVFTLRSRA